MRLTNDMREELVNRVMKKNPLHTQIRDAINDKGELAKELYHELFGITKLKIDRSTIPREFFNFDNRFFVTVSVGVLKMIDTMQGNPDTKRTSDARCTVHLEASLPLPRGYSDYSLPNDVAAEVYIRYAMKNHELSELQRKFRRYRHELLRNLKAVTTVAKIRKQFPDIAAYIPDDWEKKPAQNVPAPTNILSDLDKKFGVAS